MYFQMLIKLIVVFITFFCLALYIRYFFPEYLSIVHKNKTGKGSLNKKSLALIILASIAGIYISKIILGIITWEVTTLW